MEFEKRLADRDRWSIGDGCSVAKVMDLLSTKTAFLVIARVPYREPGRRARDEYRLTAAGEDLLPVFLSLVQWGDAHLQDGKGPLAFVDADSGRRVQVCVTTDAGEGRPRSDDIEIRYTGARSGQPLK